MLKVEGLVCRYGKVAAVRELSIEVSEGELVSLIGANGAGKTTTLKAISGLLPPAAGRIVFRGEDITRAAPRRILTLGIAHCPEGRRVFPYMSVLENLEMGCYLRSDRVQVAADMQRCSSGSRSSTSGATRRPAPSPAASSRCWRSRAR